MHRYRQPEKSLSLSSAEEAQIQNRPLGRSGGAISALAVNQGGLCGPEIRIHGDSARGKGQDLPRCPLFKGSVLRVSLEIDFLGLRCRAISALAVNQGCLRSPETRIRSRRGSGIGIRRDIVDSRGRLC